MNLLRTWVHVLLDEVLQQWWSLHHAFLSVQLNYIFFHFYFLCEVFILQTQIYTKNTNYKFKLICLQVACRKLKNIFSPGANPPTHNSHKNVLPTQTNTASKSCRFISVCNIFLFFFSYRVFSKNWRDMWKIRVKFLMVVFW